MRKNSALRLLIIGIVLMNALVLRADDGETASGGAKQSPKLWHMTLSIAKMYETDTGTIDSFPLEMTSRVYLKDDLSSLNLAFDVDDKLKADKAGMQADYRWLHDEKKYANGNVIAKTEGDDNGQELTDWEIGLKRHIQLWDRNTRRNLDETAQRKVIIYDYDDAEAALFQALSPADAMAHIEQPPDTVRLDYRVTIPARATSTDVLSGKPPENFKMEQGYRDSLTLDYKFYEKKNQETDKKLPLEMKKNLDIVTKEKNEISYALSLKDLKIEYTPTDKNLLPETNTWQDYSKVSDNLGKFDEANWLLHANSRAKVFVGGREATDAFVIFRLARVASAPLDKNGIRVAEYKNIVSSGIWLYDNNLNESGYWIDTPSQKLDVTPKSWPRMRRLYQFIISVDRFPEFGFLYYIVVIDTLPNAYRVWMYDALPVPYETAGIIINKKEPHMDETNSKKAVVDSKWCDSTGHPIPGLN